MTEYKDLSTDEMRTLYDALEKQYEKYCALNLELNMARGKPSPEQLELSMPMLDCVSSGTDYLADDGTDCRNYGVLARPARSPHAHRRHARRHARAGRDMRRLEPQHHVRHHCSGLDNGAGRSDALGRARKRQVHLPEPRATTVISPSASTSASR